MNADGCATCPRGTRCPGGSAEALECAPGTVAPNPGTEACVKCVAGKFQAKAGQLSCTDCPRGSYCEAGANAETRCSAGYYSDTVRADDPNPIHNPNPNPNPIPNPNPNPIPNPNPNPNPNPDPNPNSKARLSALVACAACGGGCRAAIDASTGEPTARERRLDRRARTRHRARLAPSRSRDPILSTALATLLVWLLSRHSLTRCASRPRHSSTPSTTCVASSRR